MTKKGSAPDVYFSFETPLAIGDLYVDPGLAGRKGKVTMLDPESAFKPPGAIKRSINTLGYEYQEQCTNVKDPKAVKEKYKDYMPPRQMYTNPCKKGGGGVLTGGVLFGWEEKGKFPEHVPDDYDSARKARKAELEEHKKKVQEAPFRGLDYGNKTFQNNTEAFHCDEPSHIPREPKPSNIKILQHESAFRPPNPSKTGALHGCMGPFPEHIPDPPPVVTRKPKAEGDVQPGFKTNMPMKVCNPTPSVTTMLRNMRAERPQSFMRPVL